METILLFSTSLIIAVICSKGVNAQSTVTGEQCIDVGENATLYCTSTPGTFGQLQWRKGSASESDSEASLIIQYTEGVPAIINTGGDHYMFDKDNPQYPLTIIGFTEADSGRYWCRVFTDIFRGGNLDIRTRVPPTSITMSQGTNNLNNSEPVKLEKDKIATFTCTVPNICPEADFTWKLDGENIPSGSPEPVDEDLLINSTNTVTFEAKLGQRRLECNATNKAGDDGVSTFVTLNVEEPPETTTPVPATASDTPTKGAESSQLSGGAIAGIAIGGVAVLCLIGVVIYLIVKKTK